MMIQHKTVQIVLEEMLFTHKWCSLMFLWSLLVELRGVCVCVHVCDIGFGGLLKVLDNVFSLNSTFLIFLGE